MVHTCLALSKHCFKADQPAPTPSKPHSACFRPSAASPSPPFNCSKTSLDTYIGVHSWDEWMTAVFKESVQHLSTCTFDRAVDPFSIVRSISSVEFRPLVDPPFCQPSSSPPQIKGDRHSSVSCPLSLSYPHLRMLLSTIKPTAPASCPLTS